MINHDNEKLMRSRALNASDLSVNRFAVKVSNRGDRVHAVLCWGKRQKSWTHWELNPTPLAC